MRKTGYALKEPQDLAPQLRGQGQGDDNGRIQPPFKGRKAEERTAVFTNADGVLLRPSRVGDPVHHMRSGGGAKGDDRIKGKDTRCSPSGQIMQNAKKVRQKEQYKKRPGVHHKNRAAAGQVLYLAFDEGTLPGGARFGEEGVSA